MTKPPTSLRVPPVLANQVEAYATEHELPRNAAYVRLIELGLSVDKPLALPPEREKAIDRIMRPMKVQHPAPAQPTTTRTLATKGKRLIGYDSDHKPIYR